jgi:hypothetical protein
MMKPSTLLKVATLVVLGICSSFTTSMLLAQRSPSKGDTANGIEAFSKRQANPAQPERAVLGNTIPEQHLVASCHLDSMDVVAQNGSIALSAAATIMDKRPKFSYVWTLSIRDSSDKEIFGRNYDHQVFSMPSKPITFTELIPVNPGSYTVELQLWYARPNSDFTKLRNQRETHSDVYLSGVRPIQIGK